MIHPILRTATDLASAAPSPDRRPCSELQSFTRVLCRSANWRYTTDNGLQILNGIMLYGNGSMSMSPADTTAAAAAAASLGALLTGPSPVTCPGGPQPPWTCSGTFINGTGTAGAAQLRSTVSRLINVTTDSLMISISNNLTVDAASWRPVELPPGMVLSVYGNTMSPVQIDFGGVAGAFVAASYNAAGATIRIKDVSLLGLPYSPMVTSTLDYFAAWAHPLRVSRSGGNGSATPTPQLILTGCNLVVGELEAGWLSQTLGAAAAVNALDGRPWLARLFSMPVSATVIGTSSSSGIVKVTSLDDASKVVRLTDCTIIRFSAFIGGPVSPAASGSLLSWPLGEQYVSQVLTQVSWYTSDTIMFTDVKFWGWEGEDVAITSALPQGAPTPALSYDVSYDPAGYPPPSPPSPSPPPRPSPPPSPPPPPSPSPPPQPQSPLPPSPRPPPALADAASSPPPPPQRNGDKGLGPTIGIAVGVSVGAVAAIAVVVGFVLYHRQRGSGAGGYKYGDSMDVGYGSSYGNGQGQNSGGGRFFRGWPRGASSSGYSSQPPSGPGGARAGKRLDSKESGGLRSSVPTTLTTVRATNDSSGLAATPDSVDSGNASSGQDPLERLQQEAAAAPTPAEAMAVLAAAATGSGAAAGGRAASGAVMPPPMFSAVPQLEIVVVQDEKLPGGDLGSAVGSVAAGLSASWAPRAGPLAALPGSRAPPPAAVGAGAVTAGAAAAARGAAPASDGAAAATGSASIHLGMSLLQTMDIESALQAYSSRSVEPHSDSTGPTAQLQDAKQGTWRGLRVAVKTLVVHDALLGVEGRRRQRAILEAAISTSLHHPNVVSTYAFEVKPLGVVAAPSGGKGGAGGGGNGVGGAGVEGASDGTGSALSNERSVWESAGDVYKLYIIQEYCDVGTLRDALANGVVGSVAAGGAAALCAMTLALDVACGMCHIHSKNIVHGDLSSANILLTNLKHLGPLGQAPGMPSGLAGLGAMGGPGAAGAPHNIFGALADAMATGRAGNSRSIASQVMRLRGLWRPPVIAKVADFGLSVRMGEGQTHASNKFQGTPLYSAPEVLTRGHLTKSSDVFSYGVMLLEFFYGSHIAEVKARRAAGLAAADASAPQPPHASIAGGRFGVAVPASCPPHLQHLMFACLAQEPGARPTFEQVVDSLVDMLLAEHTVLQQLQMHPQSPAQAAPSAPAAAAPAMAPAAAAGGPPGGALPAGAMPVTATAVALRRFQPVRARAAMAGRPVALSRMAVPDSGSAGPSGSR
ncbi:hypothetical protein GPECTOR_52g51 [Gonium pectorale]|uniref:Protein kinase domain-containing protein n=1 Tax=Gonium pectorale TaxID=33097 RepID=A0A150G726_GONPE|nr:hypothetical protein GPECTOR_52g51 [Gonium pectorale]|eukprot:KXZ45652.1 hypothetical protein GPECTOR_52g51 [Gonium pectorale]